MACLAAFLFLVIPFLQSIHCETTTATLDSSWADGFKMKISLQFLAQVSGGWTMTIQFSKPTPNLQIWKASIVSVSGDSKTYNLENMSWNPDFSLCEVYEMYFTAGKDLNSATPTATVEFLRKSGGNDNLDQNACGPTTAPISTTTTSAPATTVATNSSTTTTTAPTTASPTAYNYDLLLHKSILFYEAQRSGTLPNTNRIPWRGDSALGDKGDSNEDLTGGWYDAGDFVKFGFPMASSVTVLAWGIIQYRDAYQAAGELDNALDSIKWVTDYFIKAHTAKYEFYGQVGDGNVDHGYWGRPEEMTMARPAFKITTSQPGSDLAAETAAALAATAIAFQATDSAYAATLIQHAEELYEFADIYRGKYSDSITNAANFYQSFSGYNDELVWGAAWLYKATQKQLYLTKAESYYQQFGMSGASWAFSWDDKRAGAQMLLASITGSASYKSNIQGTLDSWLPGNSVQYTPKGLAWRNQWGVNRYAANMAFLALIAADHGIKPTVYRPWAQQQIHYMLGDSGRSYVVGFGANPPQRPHHSSSSCPDLPAPCDWDEYNSAGPNPQTLHGALVGGPDVNDNYNDVRQDYVKNEVATDYNAGFQSAVAGLKKLSMGI